MATESPKLKLYTNHLCPWAHRAHIALSELNVPFEEEIIDLSVPRTPEYLKVNPRGLVPSLSYNGEIITESGIVASFLADLFPSTLVPKSTDPNGALTRARIAFFVDTYFSKAGGPFFKTQTGKTEEERLAAADDYVNAVVKEVEPLLADAAPFFGGSSKLTLAEVLTGSFILRAYGLAKHGVIPEKIPSDLAAKAPNFHKWAQEVMKHPSVTSIWNEEEVATRTKQRLEKLRAQA
ncbi:putative Thioredoxin-like protein [Seiridium cardinale]|uniref:Thioredoxin-like protein n=1 Tax=Seiridium cardinale TaxID=138064 RepID=A0ABR2XLM2_9PEZI